MWGEWGQGGCERRIEVIVEMQKTVGGQVRPEWGARGVGVGRREGGWLVARLEVGGNVGYGGCEPRIEGIVQCTKRHCTKLRKLKKCRADTSFKFLPKILSQVSHLQNCIVQNSERRNNSKSII